MRSSEELGIKIFTVLLILAIIAFFKGLKYAKNKLTNNAEAVEAEKLKEQEEKKGGNNYLGMTLGGFLGAAFGGLGALVGCIIGYAIQEAIKNKG